MANLMIADTLIPDEVWAEAPEEADAAFMFIALHAYHRLKNLENDEQARGQHSYGDWRKQYIYELTTIADQLEIDGLPAAGTAVQNAATMADFDAHLARLITRIKAANRADLKADSVKLSYHTKEGIKAQLEELRAMINNSNLSPELQAALHKKVNAVEAEIDKSKSSLRPFWALAGAVSLAGATAVGALADFPAAVETVNKVLNMAHGEKAVEEQSEALATRPQIKHIAALQIPYEGGHKKKTESKGQGRATALIARGTD